MIDPDEPLTAPSTTVSIDSSLRLVAVKMPVFGPPSSATVNHAVAAASSIGGLAVSLAATNGVASGRSSSSTALISITGSELILL